MSKNLLILGAGQFGQVTREIAETVGHYQAIDYLDDYEPIAIGKLSEYEKFTKQYSDAIVAIDNIDIRTEYFARLKEAGYHIPKLIHPLAYVSPSAKIGEGTIVEPMALVHTCVVVGKGCIIAECSVIGHHTQIDDFCYIASHATVMQNTYMKPCTSTITGQLFFAEPVKRSMYPVKYDFSFEDGM